MSDRWTMSAEDAEEYTAALGQIMSGGWRQIALAHRLGVPQALGMTTDAWVRERIGGYVRLSLDERREAVKELTDPEGEFHLTQRQAAEVLGVGTMTVNRDLRPVPDGTAETPPLEDGGEISVPDGRAEEIAEPSVEVSLSDVAPAADPEREILDQIPDPGKAHLRAKIKRAYSTAVLQVMQGFMTIDPSITVDVLDHDTRADLQRFMVSLRAKLDHWDSALRQGIHVVEEVGRARR